jgi:hypothetical protein
VPAPVAVQRPRPAAGKCGGGAETACFLHADPNRHPVLELRLSLARMSDVI